MSDLSYSDLQNLWVQAGGDPSKAPTAAAIAMAESGGNAQALNDNAATGDYSVGLWQINLFGPLWQSRAVARGWTPQWLQNPLNNAKAAVQLSNNGANFTPWTTFTRGSYKQYLGSASGGSSGVQFASDVSGSGGGCISNISLPFGVNFCADGLIGGAAMAAGGLIMLVGAGVIVAVALSDTKVGKAGARVAGMAGGPVTASIGAYRGTQQRKAAQVKDVKATQQRTKQEEHQAAIRRSQLRISRARARTAEAQARKTSASKERQEIDVRTPEGKQHAQKILGSAA